MSIPKLYHWVWLNFKDETDLDAPVPSMFLPVMQRTMEMNAGWKFVIWNGRMVYSLLEEHYPWFIQTFKSYKYPIQRADATRYFILRKFGGLYTDLDSENIQPLDSLLEKYGGADCIIAKEKMPLVKYKPTNAIMAARPDSDFMTYLTENLARVRAIEETKLTSMEFMVYNTTGPEFLIRCLKEYRGPSKIAFLTSELYNCDCECNAAESSVYFYNKNVGSWKGREYSLWMAYRCNKSLVLTSAVFVILFMISLVLCARYYRSLKTLR
jgi:inositol phosphorylceramide mannosyltransferase catalytic subunit